MTPGAATFRPFDWDDIAVYAAFGFLMGLTAKLDLRGRCFTVMAAQHPEAFRPRRLPVFPIAVFLGLFFPLFELLTHWNTPFRGDHSVFVTCLAGSAVSAGAWLFHAWSLLDADDLRKKNEIAEFLSDPNSPVPPARPPGEVSPLRLRLWKWLNIAVFIGLTVYVMQELQSR